ncbi:MAG: ABC transporter permease [Ekhidna sp.]
MNNTPPKYPLRLLRLFCKPEYLEEIEGDLLERFEKRPSKWRMTLEVLKLLRAALIKPANGGKLNYYGMFKNYFKVGYRNLIRNKSHSFINVGGLAIALAAFILIGLWINDELSFDKHNRNSDKVARVLKKRTIGGETAVRFALPIPIVEELSTIYGEDFEHVVVSGFQSSSLVDTQEKQLYLEGNFMGADAPKLLDLTMVKGSHESLSNHFSVIISERSAKALFGSNDPIGKPIVIDGEVTMTITGIFEEIPQQSSFHGLSFIANFDGYVTTQDWIMRAKKSANWGSNFVQVFVQLAHHATREDVDRKIENLIYDHASDYDKQADPKVFLQPMEDWHLKSNWENGVQTGGAITYVWMFGFIGIFILLLACINFMNLSTAQAEKRAQEVGIRKSMGSHRLQLVSQFFIESLVIILFAFILSIGICSLALAPFNQLADKHISFPITEPFFWLSAICFIVFTSLISASYPAIYLSSFSPIKALKMTFSTGKRAKTFRRVLVVTQFSISITLIAATIVVNQQIDHSMDRPMGYEAENLLSVKAYHQDYSNKQQVIADELLKSGVVASVSQSSSSLTEPNKVYGGFDWEGKDPQLLTNFIFYEVTPSFGKTVQWNILSGRDFTAKKSDEKAFIINQSAVKYMGIKDPVGKILSRNRKDYRIIGVVDDLILEDPFQEIRPAVYVIDVEETQWIQIRLAENTSIPTAVAKIEDVFAGILPNVPFGFDLTYQKYLTKFSSLSQVRNLSSTFALLAIFISCMGLFGLASYVVETKTKEIGIRKVLGARVSGLVLALSWEFGLMVLIACVIAIPISYLFGYQWLESFAYRIDLQWWYFGTAALIAMTIAGMTVSSKTIRAASMNPAESLKDE